MSCKVMAILHEKGNILCIKRVAEFLIIRLINACNIECIDLYNFILSTAWTFSFVVYCTKVLLAKTTGNEQRSLSNTGSTIYHYNLLCLQLFKQLLRLTVWSGWWSSWSSSGCICSSSGHYCIDTSMFVHVEVSQYKFCDLLTCQRSFTASQYSQ